MNKNINSFSVNRLFHLLMSEFRFLTKYGILLIYGVFTIFYVGLLLFIPNTASSIETGKLSARSITAIILIFTDPAAMGLFFMGAIILLEKSQRVESSLAVSPINVSEYIWGKVCALMVVGLIVAFILKIFASIGSSSTADFSTGFSSTPSSGLGAVSGVATSADGVQESLVSTACSMLTLILGVCLSSVLFSLCSLIVASHITSLNKFIIAIVPFEIILCLPPLLFIFGVLQNPLWYIHPGVAAIELIGGKTRYWQFAVISLLLWNLLVYFVCKKAVKKSFIKMDGAKI